jgi:hypothetical protein
LSVLNKAAPSGPPEALLHMLAAPQVCVAG